MPNKKNPVSLSTVFQECHRKFSDRNPHYIYRTLTTGMVAKALDVAPRTVTKMVDSGRLKAHRIPGSCDRRVYVDDFVNFCIKHDIRIDPNYLPTRVIAFGVDIDETPDFAEYVEDTITFGLIQYKAPIRAAIIGDRHGVGIADVATRTVLNLHPYSKVTLVLSEDVGSTAIDTLRINEMGELEKTKINILQRPLHPGSILESVGLDPLNKPLTMSKDSA